MPCVLRFLIKAGGTPYSAALASLSMSPAIAARCYLSESQKVKNCKKETSFKAIVCKWKTKNTATKLQRLQRKLEPQLECLAKTVLSQESHCGEFHNPLDNTTAEPDTCAGEINAEPDTCAGEIKVEHINLNIGHTDLNPTDIQWLTTQAAFLFL